MDAEQTETETQSKTAFTIVVHSWATPIVGVVMLVIGLVGGYFGRQLITPGAAQPAAATQPAAALPTSASVEPQSQSDPQQVMDYVVSQTRHFKGDANAPVTIIEYSDYQWPYCGQFATGAGRQIDEEYVTNGTVRFGYQHFTFLGPESQWAGEASECAADQNAFWEYHDKLFDSQSGENSGAFSKENLKGFAVELGLDAEAFNDCLDSGKYTSIVEAETSRAQSLGVRSTPTFLVNGKPLIGAQPFDVFKQAIEAELNTGSP